MRSRLTIGSLAIAAGLLILSRSPAHAEPLDTGCDAVATPRGGGARPGGERASSSAAMAVPRIGASVSDAAGGGAVVRSVAPEYPSAMLEPGDVIVSVNDEPVKNAQDLARDVERAPGDTPLLLRVRRGGELRLLGIRLAEPSAPPEPSIGGGPSKPDASVPDDDAGAPHEEPGDAEP